MEKLSPKQEFLNELDKFLEKLNEIDNNTPWSTVEPSWWCDLSNLQREIYKIKEKKY